MNIARELRVVAGILVVFSAGALSAASTAWQDGRFHIDVPGVLHRSDIFLGRPNAQPGDAMPLGNGRLGVAVVGAGKQAPAGAEFVEGHAGGRSLSEGTGTAGRLQRNLTEGDEDS